MRASGGRRRSRRSLSHAGGSVRTRTQLKDQLIGQADIVIALKPELDIKRIDGVGYEPGPLPDPASWHIDNIRILHDHFDGKVQHLIAELTPPGAKSGRAGSRSRRNSRDRL